MINFNDDQNCVKKLGGNVSLILPEGWGWGGGLYV